MVGDVPVGQVLDDPLGEGKWLDLVRGDRVAQDGSAQVAQAGERHRSLPEPDVTVSGSVKRASGVSVPCVWTRLEYCPEWPRRGGYLPRGNDSPLWMVVAAQSVGLPVCSGLHGHPFSSGLPDPESPADKGVGAESLLSHRSGFALRTLLLKYSPVVRHDRQVQPIRRKLDGGDLVLPVVVKVVAADKGEKTSAPLLWFELKVSAVKIVRVTGRLLRARHR